MVSSTIFRFDAAERGRTLDFARRLGAIHRKAAAVLVPVVLLTAVTYGVQTLIPVAVILASLVALGPALRRSERPERVLVAELLVVQLGIVAIIALSDEFQLDSLGLLILPAAAGCLLLPRPVMALTTLWSVAVTVATAFAVDADRVAEAPPILILPVGVMLCVALPAAMIRQLELDSRGTAMVDSLTGALNRVALETRIAELTAQAHALPLRVGVIMADLDHFKLVNDELGHEAGDVVLCEIVRRMRAILGPLTPVYRVGGEEFAVLMAGADEQQVAAVAERLREAVRAEPIVDRAVTMSFGIAAGTLDEHSVARILEVADEALYRAKRAGRDRVSAANLMPMSVVDSALGGAMAPAAPTTGSTFVAGAPSAGDSIDAGEHCDEPRLPAAAVVVAPVAVALGSDRSNWMVRGDFERDHMRESAHALSKTHHGALGFVFVALIASTPWIGWHLLVPAAFAVIAYHVAERRIGSVRHPEFVLAAAWLGVQLSIFAGALIADPGEPYMLVLFAPMLIGMTAVFPTRGVVFNSGVTVALTVSAALIARSDLVHIDQLGLLGPPILIVVGIAMMSSVTGRSAIEHRTMAVVDPLTGLLTRAALQSRLAEVKHESQVAGARVSVIAFDVDDFKSLNDTHGHAMGDAVLRAVGQATRGNVQALEWAFRLGGDEFVIVVPSAQTAAIGLAERIRSTLADLVVDDLHITGSFGVAATGDGEPFDFDAVARRADAALYEAKRGGRNRVAVAPVVRPGPAPVATVLRGVA